MKVNVYRFFLHDIVFLHIVTKLKSSNLYNYLYQYLSGFNTHYTMVHLTSSIYSTVSETFISFTLTNVEFRKSRDFFAWILRGSSVGFAWN